MNPARFGVIGSGWRSEFFLRIAAALPDQLQAAGVVARSQARREAIAREFHVATPDSLDELIAAGPAFVVVSTPWDVTPVLLRELTERGIPALAETPPAPDIDGLRALAPLARTGRIQVAEQYQYQPFHATRIALAKSGRLGRVSEVRVSAAHGYHGINLIRRLLGLDREPLAIRANRFVTPIVAGPNRHGPPPSLRLIESEVVVAFLDAGDRLGVYDFTDEQYFSPIRSRSVVVRGDRGEIRDRSIRYLLDHRTVADLVLTRHDAGQDGNLEGQYLRGITLGQEWIYRNPFAPARLFDDEIAVATCLTGMAAWLEGGPDVCSLADAAQDHYLNLLIGEAARTGETVRSAAHVWDSLN
jgi:predicted dehydrogenase